MAETGDLNTMRRLFTSESVTEGHPDKVCDQVSDAVLDAILAQDPKAHVACECAAKTGFLMVFGEASGNFDVDYEAIARKTICEIGYDSEDVCFDGNTCDIIVHMEEQSADIAMGVNESYEVKSGNEKNDDALIGAGDQGMMFGYACRETAELMPMSTQLAHELAKKLTAVRKDGTLPYLGPDGKTQVTVEYNNDVITRIDTVVVSTQHSADVSLDQVRHDMISHVIKPVIPEELLDGETAPLPTEAVESITLVDEETVAWLDGNDQRQYPPSFGSPYAGQDTSHFRNFNFFTGLYR